ncbi:MAG: lactonase family protein [Spirochaetales bacterium]|nr:lactonase family protein [Spirochaetales bacterium]
MSNRRSIFAVGTYTRMSNSKAVGEGILILELDDDTGLLSEISRYTDVENPSYLAFDKEERVILSVTENMEDGGMVTSFRLTEDLSLVELSLSAGQGRSVCHISFSTERKLVFTSSYSDGVLAVHPYSRGIIDKSKLKISYSGRGPNGVRQEGPHTHQAVVSPDGNYLLVCDLGTDKIYIHRIDSLTSSGADGMPIRTFSTHAGSGPRHLVFVPGTDLLILVCELAPIAVLLRWNSETGTIEKLSGIQLASGVSLGLAQPGAVKIHPSGKTAVISCRGSNTLSVIGLSITDLPVNSSTQGLQPESESASGNIRLHGMEKFSLLKEISCGGVNPRDLEFSPSGRWLLVANQDSSEIWDIEFDLLSGLPTGKWGKRFPIGTPACILNI